MNIARKFFTIDKESPRYASMDEKQQILFESGVNVVKKYIADTANSDGKKDVFAMVSDNGIDDYKATNEKFVEKLVKFSMERAGFSTENFQIGMVRNPQVNKNTSFRENFAAVVAQIMTPIIPAIVSNEFNGFADISNIAWGDTARFLVHSNDTFYVSRQAEGIKEGTVQRLYNKEVTVNPEPLNIKVAVDWHQVAAGIFDFGEWVYRIGVSYSSYINMMIVNAFNTAIANGITASSPYFTNGFTTTKFAKLADTLRAANGGANVRAYGVLAALAAIIPTGNQANMQMGIGEEWSKIGHLTDYMGTELVRIPPIMLPNTVNTTALLGIPSDTIYLIADGGYKPAKIVFEGQTVTTDIIPTEAPDKEMGLNVTMRVGLGFMTVSKFGAITGVTL